MNDTTGTNLQKKSDEPRYSKAITAHFSIVCLVILLISLFASGCGSTKQAVQTQAAGQQEPVTITVAIKGSGYLNDEETQRYITDPVKKKYPWITVERVPYNTDGTHLPELIAAGQTPDIIMTNDINGFPELHDLNLLEPLGGFLKKFSFDTNRFEPETLDAVNINSQSEELVGIPFTRHFQALYYNKAIFDKFGVSYPKDGMTWEDAADLAAKVTRKEGGTQYQGLEPNVIQRPASQLSLPYIDPKSNKAIFNTDAWKNVLEMMAKIHQIPGNEKILGKDKANLMFTKDRTLAMLAGNNILYSAGLDKLSDFDWDMVSTPVWPQAPGKEPRIDETVLVPTSTGKHQDDAFRVISTVVSDEVQLDMAQQGRISVMKDAKFRQAFGKDLPFLQGKNIQGIYKTTAAASFVPTLYDTIAMDAMNEALGNMVSKGTDVNTALRDAEESVNKQIEEKDSGK